MESGPAVDPGRVADGTPVLAALVIQVLSCWWQVLRASWAPWTARCMSSHVWPTDWESCACESCCLKVSFSRNSLSLSVSTLCRSHSRSFTVLRHTLWFSRASVESSAAWGWEMGWGGVCVCHHGPGWSALCVASGSCLMAGWDTHHRLASSGTGELRSNSSGFLDAHPVVGRSRARASGTHTRSRWHFRHVVSQR